MSLERILRVVPLWAILLAGAGEPQGLLAQADPCTLIPDPGPCEAAIPAWYFDGDFGVCTQFTWGGCGGTVPFSTLEDCVAAGCEANGPLAGLCDSIGIAVESVGNAESGTLSIWVAPSYTTPYWFGYAGFALFDEEGNMLAAENVATAPNAYGFDGTVEAHLRFLEYQSGVDLSTWTTPFYCELRLYEGWMAGEVVERCQWVWTQFGEAMGVDSEAREAAPVWTSYDLLGRPVVPAPGQLVIQRDARGHTRKLISE